MRCFQSSFVERRTRNVNAGKMLLMVAAMAIIGAGCASAPRSTGVSHPPRGQSGLAVGIASYYAKKFHGRKTASGEKFNMHALTAAHRTLPFGTSVKVTNLANERSVVVRINDRGPFIGGRILDVSYEAARRLQMVAQGTARVRIETLGDRQLSEARD